MAAAVKHLIALLLLALGLAAPLAAHGAAQGEERSKHFVFGLSFGVVAPRGDLSDGYKVGGMGTGFAGIVGPRFGAQLMMGSIEPRTRQSTHDAYSALLGSPTRVSLAIVPVELQAVAALPSQTSKTALTLQVGAGFHNVTVHVQDSDTEIDSDSHFGYSAGAGFRYTRRPGGAFGLRGLFHGSGSLRYFTAQIDVTFVI